MATNGLGLPPTRQSLVVVNGTLCRTTYSDRYNAKDEGGARFPFGNVEDHGIAPHELCFSKINSHGKTLHFNEPAISVFSSFNGDETGKTDDNRFVGISQTTIPEPFAGNGHLSMCAAGVVRIFNTGRGPIDIGDKVYWDLPSDKNGFVPIEGMPKSKLYAHTKPLKHEAVRSTSDAIMDITKVTGDEAAKRKNIEKLLSEAEANKSRVIGVALSRAQSGQSFDILLRYC